MSSKEKFGIDFQKYHDWVRTTLEKYREDLDKFFEENEKNMKKEIKQYDKRSIDKMNAVEDKLSFIRIENGRYNFKLNKKWEELQDKLQMFYVMNDNLIRLYNKVRQEFLKSQKEVNNIIQYLNSAKFNPNGNKTTYDKFNKRVELTKPQITLYDNVLPAINSFDDITKNMFITPRNNNSNNDSKLNSNKKNSKFTRLLKKKNTVNLDVMGFSFNKLNKINENYNNNIYTNVNIQENDDGQNNIKNNLSEKKISTRKNTFRKNNLIIEEKNEYNSLNKKEVKSENTKKILNEIPEDENFVIERKDEHTSPYLIKNVSNKKFNNSILSPNQINSFSFETKEISNNFIKEEIKKEEKNINTNSNQITNGEEYNEIKIKFEELYDKSNDKINGLMQHLNTLIKRMNKVIFNKNDNNNLIKTTDLINERKNKKLFLEQSGNKINLSLNQSYEEKNKSIKAKENEKNNIINLKQDLKLNNKFNINDKYLIDNFKFNNYKTNEMRGNSSDVINLLKAKNKKENDIKINQINIQSVNKIENFLIKKFTEPN